MYEISKIYIRSIVAITGITSTMIYSVHVGSPDPNMLLAGIAGIVACTALDKEKTK